jgi:hypothetical protein
MDNEIRKWWHIGERTTIGLEATNGRTFPHLAFEIMVGGEHTLMLHIAVPFLFALYIWLESWPLSRRLRLPYDNRTTGFHISKDLSTFQIWNDESHWQRGKSRHWSVLNEHLLFGQSTYKQGVLQVVDGVIPMPEGNYPAKFEIAIDTWTWPRFKKPVSKLCVDVDIAGGITHPGKGTDSHNLDDDALFGMGCFVESVDTAIAEATQKVIERVNYCRVNYPLD